jgi:hypothetical protein
VHTLSFLWRKLLLAGIGAFSLLYLSGCSGSGGGVAINAAGIRGLATETLIGGAPPPFPPPPPTVRPLPGAIITVQPAGRGPEITRRRTDANGRFQIDLPPGTYLVVALRPPDQAGLPTAPDQTATVQPGTFTNLTINYVTPLP